MAKAKVAPTDHGFLGGWKILQVDAHNEKDKGNTGGIEKAIFTLSDTGDIFWKLQDETAETPFFAANFDLYEVVGTKFQVIKFVGSQSGDKIELNSSMKHRDAMHLKCGVGFTLICERVWKIDQAMEEPFSLYCAFKEGYFSDLTIKADNGRTFEVHKVILKAAAPRLAWDQTPPPLSNSPEDVLATVLHFLYTECLPDTIQEDTARRVLVVAGKLPGFHRLANLLMLYLHNMDVKNQIISYINGMHACGDNLAQIFSAKRTTAEGAVRSDNFMAEPTKLVYAIKQAIKEGAVAGVQILMICDLWSKRKGEMSKHERNEVMKYVKSRLPIFVKQLYKFFEAFREQLTKEITEGQKQDVASYLVPEMDKCLDISTDLVEEAKDAIETILRAVKERGDKKKHSTVDYLKKTVKNAMHMKELMQLKTAHEKMCELFQSMMWRQEAFECLSDDDKTYSVTKNIEQLVEEFPQILQKIEKLDTKVNDSFTMKNWKFVFKMGTSRVCWSLEKAVTHRDQFKPIISRFNKLIDREDFQTGLLQVGLLAEAPSDDPEGGMGASSMDYSTSTSSHSTSAGKQPHNVESLCIPPRASESTLAKNLGQLLESGVGTDMCFEVVTVTEEPSDIVVDHTQGQAVQTQCSERMETRHEIRAHCAVIAARCDWFRRALLSGFRESIDKKIEVHGTDPEMFRQFLMFLYSGQINLIGMSMEQKADMMSLSDRHEVDTLKHVCEGALKTDLNEDTVLYLLGLADQYHAIGLKEAALHFIAMHPLAVDSDVYQDLPQALQQEVNKCVEQNQQGSDMDSMSRYRGLQYDDPTSGSSGGGVTMKPMDTEIANMDAKSQSSDSMSSEDDPVEAVAMDRQRVMECVARIKGVIGEGVPQSDLEKLARMADFDVNRAINYYYSSV